MWNFIVDKLEQCKLRKADFIKIPQLKYEFLENMCNGFHNMTNLTEEGKEMAALIEKGINNNCFACEFAAFDCCNCPLLIFNDGKLTYACFETFSLYDILSGCVSGGRWDKAIAIAKEIRDSWRDLYD